MTLTSYNGWEASKEPAHIKIKSYAIPGTSLKIRCAEAVAPLIVGFCKEFNELIEPLDGGQLDDWGYCFRMVRGTTTKLSNHSSGTAIDLNATKHPLGKVGTFPAEKVPMIRALARKYGLFWGGDYQKRKDEQHFEINVSPKKVLELIKALGLGEK
ncbi:D-alanyl-D-alanine carboxypeptidase [uncultured Caudovirales phage]|uniref:D-alanyl-D-alanine carboxypeptidase n=1 Tax=uncultured Caudovirales phage TaxID=2100421 RepID=A0A6J5P9P7_9CAUD|nr:D-alanyl-D-alanine carboxypeptidase [uncultured Caudovirales phage]CAB4194645.1 D-alanyl-D-alanine carboxypeptidase [uncultured Caudovirales phage]